MAKPAGRAGPQHPLAASRMARGELEGRGWDKAAPRLLGRVRNDPRETNSLIVQNARWAYRDKVGLFNKIIALQRGISQDYLYLGYG